MSSNEALYAVVQFEQGSTTKVRRVIVPFADAPAAELFAIENDYADYRVTSVDASMSPQTPRRRDCVSVGRDLAPAPALV